MSVPSTACVDKKRCIWACAQACFNPLPYFILRLENIPVTYRIISYTNFSETGRSQWCWWHQQAQPPTQSDLPRSSRFINHLSPSFNPNLLRIESFANCNLVRISFWYIYPLNSFLSSSLIQTIWMLSAQLGYSHIARVDSGISLELRLLPIFFRSGFLSAWSILRFPFSSASSTEICKFDKIAASRTTRLLPWVIIGSEVSRLAFLPRHFTRQYCNSIWVSSTGRSPMLSIYLQFPFSCFHLVVDLPTPTRDMSAYPHHSPPSPTSKPLGSLTLHRRWPIWIAPNPEPTSSPCSVNPVASASGIICVCASHIHFTAIIDVRTERSTPSSQYFKISPFPF